MGGPTTISDISIYLDRGDDYKISVAIEALTLFENDVRGLRRISTVVLHPAFAYPSTCNLPDLKMSQPSKRPRSAKSDRPSSGIAGLRTVAHQPGAKRKTPAPPESAPSVAPNAGSTRGVRSKKAREVPTPDPAPLLDSDDEEEWSGNVDGADESAADGTTDDEDGGEDGAAGRSRRLKGKGEMRGKKGALMFTAEEVENLLKKERAKHPLPPTLPAASSDPTGTGVRGDVPGVGLRSVGDLDAAGQAALRCSAQIWVKQEVLKGRIDHTKKWKDQEGVGEATSILSRSLYEYAALKNAPTSMMEDLVKTYCESKYVKLSSVWLAVSDLVRTR